MSLNKKDNLGGLNQQEATSSKCKCKEWKKGTRCICPLNKECYCDNKKIGENNEK